MSYLNRGNGYEPTGYVNGGGPDADTATDHFVGQLEGVMQDVLDEFLRAAFKHGVYTTPVSPTMADGVRLVVLLEEAGEAAEVCGCNNLLKRMGEISRAMTYDNGSREKLDAELVQVITMAAAWLVAVRNRSEKASV